HAVEGNPFRAPGVRLMDVFADAELLEQPGEYAGSDYPAPWPLEHILDLRTARARPKPSWLVDGMIPAKKVVLPWGGTGEGKTYWTTEIVTAVVMRRPAFGRFPVVAEGEPGTAVMFVGEDHEYVFSRLPAIESYYDCELQGKVFVVENAIPLNYPKLRQSYV